MTQAHPITWPPAYTIKKHRQARHVKIRVRKPRLLEITVPHRFNLNEIAEILEAKRSWITKQLLHLETRYTETLPSDITLLFANQKWTVHYVNCATKFEMIERPMQELVLIGAMQKKAFCKEKLMNWLKERAAFYLLPRLKTLSDEFNLPYQSAMVRDQKTLWGSCTREKIIHLNYRLIFLPWNLASHVMIHELCHTKHLNHSERFWNLVAACDPHFEAHKKALRHADQFMPGWMEASFD